MNGSEQTGARIRLEIADHVADVRLVRTDRLNALDGAMFDSLLAIGAELRERRDVRAIVLSGDGRAFCAGLDVRSFTAMADGTVNPALTERRYGPANLAQQVVLQWRQMPVPVIAAVRGFALGGGFQLALGADMRVVHPAAKLSAMEIKWGLVPDMGGTLLIRDLVRPDVAAELVYTGRVFDGAEAHSLGLATILSEDPKTEALRLAHVITRKNPEAIRAAKRLLSIADEDVAAQILESEVEEQSALISTPNQIEAVNAERERRMPVFSDQSSSAAIENDMAKSAS